MPTQAKPAPKERRQFLRASWPADLAINLLEPSGIGSINHVNVGEGGLCFRLPANLEVKSVIRFALTRSRNRMSKTRPMECTGRVAWVTQRLDLRSMPPYLFDIGIEFINPPSVIAGLLARQESNRPAVGALMKPRIKKLTGANIRGRQFVPRIIRDGDKAAPWHLVVSVEDVPCYSQRFASERAAVIAWVQFQRVQVKRPAR